ncbi:MAG: DNA translocase FtsK 4TM domain-containing protein [bacterium]
MARRKTRKLSFFERLNLNPDINRGLLAVLLFVAGGLSALSFFEMAGVAGKFIDALLAISFGGVRYVFPIILLLVAILIVKDMDYNYQPTHWLGSILFFLGFNALVHLKIPTTQMWESSVRGEGGGIVGFLLAWPLGKYIGYWGGLVILFGLILIAVIFLFNTSLARIVELHTKLFRALGWTGKQMIRFTGLLKKEQYKTKFRIKGNYRNDNADEPDEDEIENSFKKKTLVDGDDEEEEDGEDDEDEDKKKITIKPKKPKVIIRDLPSLSLLFTTKSKPSAGDIKANAETIKDTLSNFGIEVSMGEVRVGPTVTQYSIKPAKGIKLTRITALNNDLALSLASHPIRIEAPIPGKSLVGIEVPNQKIAMVSLRELLESKEWKARKTNMNVALGKDVAGKVWCADLPSMPHMLIAGATGSGKTVCINTILLSLLYQNTAETLRLIMIDPKRVELTMYNGIPHLLTPIITDAKQTVNALRWTINEMNRRFDLLSQAGRRDINTYNTNGKEKLPHIVFVIDELADLMASTASEVEAGIIRIAQMARAVGIHLIVATQRPSTEVITGLMKANIPTRLAFSMPSLIDSRTILDCPGAEKLLGRGDMLFLSSDMSKPKRLQGAFVSEEELGRVISHLKGKHHEEPEYDETIVAGNIGSDKGTINMFGGSDDDYDPKFEEAKRIILESGKASASLLQRRLKLGYARAARILDELEEAGIVGPPDGAKPREVFTEHIMPGPEKELTENERTMDAGGSAVFDDDIYVDDDEEDEQADEDDTPDEEQPDESHVDDSEESEVDDDASAEDVDEYFDEDEEEDVEDETNEQKK